MIGILAIAACAPIPSSPTGTKSTTPVHSYSQASSDFYPDDTAANQVQATGATGSTGDTAGTESFGVVGLVGVGYGGIRVVSRDGGRSWSRTGMAEAAGGDDQELLRAVVYGDGRWIATGWKMLTSPDGEDWLDLGLLSDDPNLPPCNIVEGLAWADGSFYAACADWYGEGHVYASVDGAAWSLSGDIGPTQGHLFLSWNEGTFAAYGDTGTSYTSTDAVGWTELAGVTRATWCDGAYVSQDDCPGGAWFDGAWFTTRWPDTIQRSEDGTNWTDAYVDPDGNSLYQPRAVAEGRVALRG